MKKQRLNKPPTTPSIKHRKLLSYFLAVLFLLINYTNPIFGQVASTSPTSSPCETVDVQGVFNDDPNSDYFQGIVITGENTPIKIIKIYNSNWERVNECSGDCNFPFMLETEAGKYFVQIQFYESDWSWICQTDNIEVTVPESSNSDCQNISARGVYQSSSDNQTILQGIEITIPPSRVNVTAKIYDTNKTFITQIGGNSSLFYRTSAGKYFVVVELYTIPRIFGEERRLICRTDFLEAIVPEGNCDLTITDAVFPTSVQPGETINLQATVLNFSSTAVVNSSTVGLYQLKGGNKSLPTPMLIAETPIDYIAPGEKKTFYFSATLPDPLWNVPTYPIGDESLSNNFILLTKENANAINARKCNFPVDFKVDYPDIDLGVSFENNEGCIDNEGFLLTDLKVTNHSNITAKAPIYVNLARECSFGNELVATCLVHASAFQAYYIINEDLAPNQSVIIEKPYQLPNTSITEWTVTPFIDALSSSIDDPNEENNRAVGFFEKTVDCGSVCDCETSVPGPVCGSDGKTYDNSCDAECAGVTWTLGACGTPSCSTLDIFATPSAELQGTVQVQGISAPIAIVKIYTENWDLVYECNANCGGGIIYNADAIGKYIVQVQLYTADWKWICQTENVMVEVTQNTDCAANLFLDRDNDGVCEMDDCDDNDPNIGAKQPQGTTCDDGDPNTNNDEIQADGCTCKGMQDTGNPSCDDVQITALNTENPTLGVTLYNISGLTAPIEIVKIFNRRTYEKLYECNNDCGDGFGVELQEGEYVLQVQMYTADWGWICGKDIGFDVITGDPGPITCPDLEQIRLDDLCDACVSEVSIYSFEGNTYYAYLADNVNCADAQTIVYSCENGNQFCVDGGIIGSIECVPFFASATKLQTVWKKSEDCDNCICTLEVDPVCGSDGITYGNPCLAECAGVTWTRGECQSTQPYSDKVKANFQQGLQDTYEGLGVTGLNAPIEIVKIYDANWNRVFECSADCGNEVIIPIRDLSAGLYRVHVQMYDENWGWICETDFLEVNVPANVNGSRATQNNTVEIGIFPNPVRNRLALQTKALQGQKATVRIFNIFGKQVAEIPEQELQQTLEYIDVSHLENGLYYLNIQATNRRLISKKFIVESMK